MVEKYVGRVVEIIYLDVKGRISQRKIAVYSVRNGRVCAYCLSSKEARTFHLDGILAAQLIRECGKPKTA